jgi:peptide/nickel transport system permease protein
MIADGFGVTAAPSPATGAPADDSWPPGQAGTWRSFARHRAAMVALVVLALAVLASLLSPFLPLPAPNHVNLLIPLRGPSWGHLLGTDQLGRDELARVLAATRISLWAALLATVTGVIIGVPLGLLTGFRGGRMMDSFVSRTFDCLQSIPALILAIAIVAALGRELTYAMISVGIAFSPTFYRVSRAAAATVAGESFIEASRSMGQRTAKIVTTHVLGNISAPLIALTSTTFAFGILAEAALSYLGLGVQPPQASLGTMLSTAADLLNSSPQLTVEPGLMIMLLVLCISVIADALGDVTSGQGAL